MTRFRHGHATHPEWRMATELALAQIEGRSDDPLWSRNETLGFVYFTSGLAAHAQEIVALLIARTGIADWVGTCGQSIVATGVEYEDEPAIALMLADLPAGAFQVFCGTHPPPAPGTHTAAGDVAAHAALINAEPATPDLAELIEDMAGKIAGGPMFGGLASGSSDPLPQVAGRVLNGGLSGVVFSSGVGLRMQVTQGCAPLAAVHDISSCQSNLIRTLDGLPALDVMLTDLGVDASVRNSRDGQTLLRAVPPQRMRSGILVGLADGDAPRSGPKPGFGDFLVRNLVGIDPHNRLVAIGAVPREGDRLVFCTRDAQAARSDLLRICTELRDELETDGLQIRGGVYISCLARGRALFGSAGAEVGLLQSQLGDFPLVGFFANGEIARQRLYGYTGVLALFTGH
jgi:small ligand-binding sensory domain FIST